MINVLAYREQLGWNEVIIPQTRNKSYGVGRKCKDCRHVMTEWNPNERCLNCVEKDFSKIIG